MKRLGSGGVGEVHVARLVEPDPRWPPVFAVKILKDELASNPEQILRFRHEAEISVGLRSVYFPEVYEVGSFGATMFIAMERIYGMSLLELSQQLRFTAGAVIDIFAEALAGLQVLHVLVDPKTRRPLGLIHRDLSPRNILVDELGRAKVIDLGLCRSALKDWNTRAGGTLVSQKYAAPEAKRGEAIDHRADLYSIAAVMLELIDRSRMPAVLAEVLAKATAERASDRYFSATEFRAALLSIAVDREGAAIAELVRAQGQRERAAELALASSVEAPNVSDAPSGTQTILASELPTVVHAPQPIEARSEPRMVSSRAGAAIVVAAVFMASVAGTLAYLISSRPPVENAGSATSAPDPLPRASAIARSEDTTVAAKQEQRTPRGSTSRARAAVKDAPADAIDALEARLNALDQSDAALGLAEVSAAVVARADRLEDANERDAIKKLATASLVAQDVAAMKRALARLLSAERSQQ